MILSTSLNIFALAQLLFEDFNHKFDYNHLLVENLYKVGRCWLYRKISFVEAAVPQFSFSYNNFMDSTSFTTSI